MMKTSSRKLGIVFFAATVLTMTAVIARADEAGAEYAKNGSRSESDRDTVAPLLHAPKQALPSGLAASSSDRSKAKQVAANDSERVKDRRVAEGGSDKLIENRVAEGGADRLKERQLAADGSDRLKDRRVVEGGSDKLIS